MNIEDLHRDIEEYEESGDMAYARALAELSWYYDNDTREATKEVQSALNLEYPDYPKINIV
jgi:hypothetical protein